MVGCDKLNTIQISKIFRQNNMITHLIWSDLDNFFINQTFEGLKWSYRELNEFFNINSFKFNDNRNVLQDYSINWNPLKKEFNVEGESEVYFNINTQNVDYIKINFIEL